MTTATDNLPTPEVCADETPHLATRSKAHRQRFTLDGSDSLESHLARTCEKISAGVRGLVPARKLDAIMLAGGYGRGEGGVLKTPDGEKPYNDLEFYVCLRGNRHLNERLYHKPLEVLGEILTPLASAEVEFKITSLAELQRSSISMYSYDLVLGHRWLLGNKDLLALCAHHRAADQLPLAEATRLLMNRCSGLLFAQERLQRKTFTAGDADFVRRNIAKAELALGDAVVTSHGLYHWSCRERARRLEQLAVPKDLPWLPKVRKHHSAGVDFKLHPHRSVAPRSELRATHEEVTVLALEVWLWLEGRRLNRSFVSALDYALNPADKCSEMLSWRNRLMNVFHFGPAILLDSRASRHPRQRLFRALALLLWEPAALIDRASLAGVQTELRTSARSYAELVSAYAGLWKRFN